MMIQNDNINKYVDLCQLYEQMDEKEREALVRVAGKLFEMQAAIGNEKSGLLMGIEKTEMT